MAARTAEYYSSVPTHIAPVSFDAGIPSFGNSPSSPRISTKNIVEGAIAVLTASPKPGSPIQNDESFNPYQDPWSPELNKSIKVESPSPPAPRPLATKKRSYRYAVPAPSSGASGFVSRPLPEATNAGIAKQFPSRPSKSKSGDGDESASAARSAASTANRRSLSMTESSTNPPPMQKKGSFMSRIGQSVSRRGKSNKDETAATPLAAENINESHGLTHSASMGDILSPPVMPAAGRPRMPRLSNPGTPGTPERPQSRNFQIPQTLAEWEAFNKELLERSQRPRPQPQNSYGLRPPSMIGMSQPLSSILEVSIQTDLSAPLLKGTPVGSRTPGTRTPRSGSGSNSNSPSGANTPRRTPGTLPVELPPPIVLGDWEKALLSPRPLPNSELPSSDAKSPRPKSVLLTSNRASYAGESRPSFPTRHSSSNTTTMSTTPPDATPVASTAPTTLSSDTLSARHRAASLPDISPLSTHRPALTPIVTNVESQSLWKRPGGGSKKEKEEKRARRASASVEAVAKPLAEKQINEMMISRRVSKDSLNRNVLVKRNRSSMDVTDLAALKARDNSVVALNNSETDLSVDRNAATAPKKKRNSFSSMFKKKSSSDSLASKAKAEPIPAPSKVPAGPPPGAAAAAIPSQFTAGHTYEVQAPLPEILALNSNSGHISSTSHSSIVPDQSPAPPAQVATGSVSKKGSFSFGFGKLKKASVAETSLASTSQLRLPQATPLSGNGQQVESPISDTTTTATTKDTSPKRSSKRFSFGLKKKEGSESTAELPRPTSRQDLLATASTAEPSSTRGVPNNEEGLAVATKRRSFIPAMRKKEGSESTTDLSRSASTQDLATANRVDASAPKPVAPPADEEPHRPDAINAKRRSFIYGIQSMGKKSGRESKTDLVGDDERQPSPPAAEAPPVQDVPTQQESHSTAPTKTVNKRRSFNLGFQSTKKKMDPSESKIDLASISGPQPLISAAHAPAPEATPALSDETPADTAPAAPKPRTRAFSFGMRKKEASESTADLPSALTQQPQAPIHVEAIPVTSEATSNGSTPDIASKHRSGVFGFAVKRKEVPEPTMDLVSALAQGPVQDDSIPVPHETTPTGPAVDIGSKRRSGVFGFGVKKKEASDSTMDLTSALDQYAPQPAVHNEAAQSGPEDVPSKPEDAFIKVRSRAFSFLKKKAEGIEDVKADETPVLDITANKASVDGEAARGYLSDGASDLTPTAGRAKESSTSLPASAEQSTSKSKRNSFWSSKKEPPTEDAAAATAAPRAQSPAATEEWEEIPPSIPGQYIPSAGVPGSPSLKPLDLRSGGSRTASPSPGGKEFANQQSQRPTIRERVSSLMKRTPSEDAIFKMETPRYQPPPPPSELSSPHSISDKSLPAGQFRTLTGKMTLAEAAASRPKPPSTPDKARTSRFFSDESENQTTQPALHLDANSERWSEDLMRDMGDIHPSTPGAPLEMMLGGSGGLTPGKTMAQAAVSTDSLATSRYESA
ncbi:hypothetical protein FRB96_000499 [Tulasnella sp. 330]|nr:hypothetical protein FRB96_000499 [Tulasnella sp. 330]